MDYYKKFIVEPGSKVKLSDADPDYTKGIDGKEEAELRTSENVTRMAELQYNLYAENRQSLLIILQAMDAGGKDGTINHVFAPLNPQGCRVASFKVPTSEESAHDFLWRIHHRAPRHGEIVIFNRSQYESVLVERVHDLAPRKIIDQRYDQINSFEQILHSNRTTILKFFLNISREEQLKRFLARLDTPAKNWKVSDADFKEREYWDQYMKAFELALGKCSTSIAPWFIIPSNNKWFRDLAISEIVLQTMKNMKMKLPAPTADIEALRKIALDEVAPKKKKNSH